MCQEDAALSSSRVVASTAEQVRRLPPYNTHQLFPGMRLLSLGERYASGLRSQLWMPLKRIGLCPTHVR